MTVDLKPCPRCGVPLTAALADLVASDDPDFACPHVKDAG